MRLNFPETSLGISLTTRAFILTLSPITFLRAEIHRATETAKALTKFGFNQLSLHRIFATCDVDNKRSAHVLEKIGMQNEGSLREHKWIRGAWRDSYLYAIIIQVTQALT